MAVPFNLKDLSPIELLNIDAAILAELRARGIIRTDNAPLGDYTEYLVARTLGLTLQRNSSAGYDAIDEQDNIKYQIKGRRPSDTNPSTQVSAIRRLEAQNFDFLIAVLFHHDFRVKKAYKIPHAVVVEHARPVPYSNSHRLHIQGLLLTHTDTEDITRKFDPVNE